MATRDVIADPYRMLATVGDFYQAICEGEIAPPVAWSDIFPDLEDAFDC
jgi:hypothetical protein